MDGSGSHSKISQIDRIIRAKMYFWHFPSCKPTVGRQVTKQQTLIATTTKLALHGTISVGIINVEFFVNSQIIPVHHRCERNIRKTQTINKKVIIPAPAVAAAAVVAAAADDVVIHIQLNYVVLSAPPNAWMWDLCDSVCVCAMRRKGEKWATWAR